MFRFVLLIFLLLLQFSFSQNFTVKLSENVIGLNDSFEIVFTLDGSGSSFSPPSFSEDFVVLSGPNRSNSVQIINGVRTQESTYKYILKPKKEGVFTILPANIKVKGKTIGTKPITLQVKKGMVSKKPNTPHNIAARKIHLEVKSNKYKCYIGEPIVLTYTLYFNLNVGNLTLDKIQYNGFWTENVELDSEQKQVQYKGELYNSAVIKQVVLIPQSKGKFVIDKFNLDMVVSIPSNRRDFFGMLSSQSINFSVSSNEIVLGVIPLPVQGKPSNFSGAVGDFKLEVNLDALDTISVNESVTLDVMVSGKGNLNLLSTPTIDFDNGLEVYEPKNLDKINIGKRGISGYKKEEYLIVPRYKGEYILESVDFNFFSPKLKKYISLSSPSKTFFVTKEKFNNEYSVENNFNKEVIDVLNEDVRFIKTQPDFNHYRHSFPNSFFFLILLFLPIFILFVMWLYYKKYLHLDWFFNITFSQELKQKLDNSHLLLIKNKYEEFHTSLLDVLFFYVIKKFNIGKNDLTTDKIVLLLLQNGLERPFVTEFEELIQIIQLYKYGVSSDLKIDNDILLKRVSKIINDIDKRL